MKKSDVFQTKHLSAGDLAGSPLVLTIERAVPTMMKAFGGGAERQKVVLHFARAKKTLPLNATNWDSVVDATGEDDSDKWPGHRIEVYPDQVEVDGVMKDCIRLRRPSAELQLSPPDGKLPPNVADGHDEPLPF